MPLETITALILSACIAVFFTVNLHNILIVHKRRGNAKPYAEIPSPSGTVVAMAALGTFAYFLEVLAYAFLVFTELTSALPDFLFRFQSPLPPYLQVLGLALTTAGYALFIWSVIARGRYSVSWNMTENHKLITHGPYSLARHPSYLGYFLMFIGFPLIWTNAFTLIPLLAIPGYYRVTFQEEKLLTQRFGNEYTEYQKKVGRFIPKLRRQLDTHKDKYPARTHQP